MSFRSVAMYRCAWGHTKTQEIPPPRPGESEPRPPAPQLPCDVCSRSASQNAKRNRPYEVKPLVFEGVRRVKNSAAQLRG